MYIDMGEWIAGKQDMPGLIIEGHQIAKNDRQIAKNVVSRCTYVSTVIRSAF